MFTTNKRNPQSDDETRNEFMEGNTLFLIGSKNGIGETDDTKDQFGLMPYLSEDVREWASWVMVMQSASLS
mgnify:CR=1 FL=1